MIAVITTLVHTSTSDRADYMIVLPPFAKDDDLSIDSIGEKDPPLFVGFGTI